MIEATQKKLREARFFLRLPEFVAALMEYLQAESPVLEDRGAVADETDVGQPQGAHSGSTPASASATTIARSSP